MGIPRFLSFVLTVCLLSSIGFAQATDNDEFKIMFYNVENLFDTANNPNTNDEEFLPIGDKKWDNYRYWKKINKTFQVIAAAGDAEPPDIIGFCEVEDFLPLYHIVNNTPLMKYPYTIIHRNSPDRRGIDVGMVVRSDRVSVISQQYLPVVFPWDTAAKTREILHATLLLQEDTVHVFVNHWPSRRGGQAQSEPRRMEAAKVVASAVDSILSTNAMAKVVIMGDFNDEPQNNSIRFLKTELGLTNLSDQLEATCKCGTYKYRSEWNMLDQMLISPGLIAHDGLLVSDVGLEIIDDAFLLETDASYGGQKPIRTYLGPRYIGGYSDHLPVVLHLREK